MIILDTDHINTLQIAKGPAFDTLLGNMMGSSDQDFVTTVITLEEQMRGWMALINKSRDIERQVHPYQRLGNLVQFFARWTLLPFDEEATNQFRRLRDHKIRIGTMDLKIAAIALSQSALVLSANLRDFRQVPNLRVEDWMH